jgi:DNA-binding XRE family transcriptional regulator
MRQRAAGDAPDVSFGTHQYGGYVLSVDIRHARGDSSPVDFRDRFAANLIRCRKEAGLSQEELARRAALNRTQISLLENSQRTPRIDTVVKVAGALGVDPAALLRGMRWTPSETRPGAFDLSDDS